MGAPKKWTQKKAPPRLDSGAALTSLELRSPGPKFADRLLNGVRAAWVQPCAHFRRNTCALVHTRAGRFSFREVTLADLRITESCGTLERTARGPCRLQGHWRPAVSGKPATRAPSRQPASQRNFIDLVM